MKEQQTLQKKLIEEKGLEPNMALQLAEVAWVDEDEPPLLCEWHADRVLPFLLLASNIHSPSRAGRNCHRVFLFLLHSYFEMFLKLLPNPDRRPISSASTRPLPMSAAFFIPHQRFFYLNSFH